MTAANVFQPTAAANMGCMGSKEAAPTRRKYRDQSRDRGASPDRTSRSAGTVPKRAPAPLPTPDPEPEPEKVDPKDVFIALYDYDARYVFTVRTSLQRSHASLLDTAPSSCVCLHL